MMSEVMFQLMSQPTFEHMYKSQTFLGLLGEIQVGEVLSAILPALGMPLNQQRTKRDFEQLEIREDMRRLHGARINTARRSQHWIYSQRLGDRSGLF